ncbi:MAG: penicillin acylase family protein [Anaeromyxobacter sp.]
MRAKLVVLCALASAVLACAKSGDLADSLTVTPSGDVTASGPVSLSATVTGGAEVSWSLTGAGTLSGSKGPFVVWRPPAVAGAGQTATVTATAGKHSQAVHISYAAQALTPKKIASLSAAVTVTYDAWQVPHVDCAIDTDCFAVQGYLHARDRLFQMDFLRRVARGRLSELVGPLGLEQDVQLRTLFTMRNGARIEDALVTAMDPATKARVQAYVDGINARLGELTDADLPGEYAQLPVPVKAADLPAWTLADVTGLARLQQFQLSESIGAEADYGKFVLAFGTGGKFKTWVRAQLPVQARTYTLVAPPAAAAPAPAPQVDAAALGAWGASLGPLGVRHGALREALHAEVGEVGSNNWVVDAAHSANGHAMVANDPHLSLPYPPNFYLAQMTSRRAADGMDIVGGSFPGTPGALVGRGKHVGWGVTVVGYDVTDLYREQFLPQGSCPSAQIPCVLFKGGPVSLIPAPQSYKVRGPDGLLHEATAWPPNAPLLSAQGAVVFVVPHHGPIIQAPDAGGHAVSMRWTGHEGWTQDLKAFFGLATAASVDAAIEALKDYATGAQNFVLADDAGNIAYDPHALLPVRDFADVRKTAAANLQPPWIPLPGDGSAEWGSDPACGGVAAPRSCFLDDADVPHGKNPTWGFYVTANSDPVGVSKDNNVFAYPPYLSFDWDEIGFRQTRITERMTKALAAGGGKIGEAELESIQTDHVSSLGRAFTEILKDASYDAAEAGSPDFKAARAMLVAWGANTKAYDCPTGLLGIDPDLSPNDPDTTNTANSAACLLFHTFVRDLLVRVFADDLGAAGLGVSSSSAVKGMLRMLEPGVTGDEASFCDDVDPDTGAPVASHTCAAQVVTSLVTAYRTLLATEGTDWRWGRHHTFTAASQFPTVTTGYVAGPYARPGGALTVDVGNPRLTASGTSFAFGSSANVRHVSVMDPAGPTTRMQLPGPQRDGPYGVVAGPDLLVDWVQNTYFDYADGAHAQAGAVATQTFDK